MYWVVDLSSLFRQLKLRDLGKKIFQVKAQLILPGMELQHSLINPEIKKFRQNV